MNNAFLLLNLFCASMEYHKKGRSYSSLKYIFSNIKLSFKNYFSKQYLDITFVNSLTHIILSKRERSHREIKSFAFCILNFQPFIQTL